MLGILGSGKLTVHHRPPLVIMKPAVMARALAGAAAPRAVMAAIVRAASAVRRRRMSVLQGFAFVLFVLLGGGGVGQYLVGRGRHGGAVGGRVGFHAFAH